MPGSGGHRATLQVHFDSRKSCDFPRVLAPTSLATNNYVGCFVINRQGDVITVPCGSAQNGVPASQECQVDECSEAAVGSRISSKPLLMAFDAVRDSVAIIQKPDLSSHTIRTIFPHLRPEHLSKIRCARPLPLAHCASARSVSPFPPSSLPSSLPPSLPPSLHPALVKAHDSVWGFQILSADK